MTFAKAGARTFIGGGGGIFIYSDSTRLASFEIILILKEISRGEAEYINIHLLLINVLAPPLTFADHLG